MRVLYSKDSEKSVIEKIIINKITPSVDYNQWLKRLDT